MNIGKTVIDAVKTGLGFIQKTGIILNKIDKKGNFTNITGKAGLINNNSIKPMYNNNLEAVINV